MDKLTEFLISMALDEAKLAKFLEDPIGTAIGAGVPRGQAEILTTRDASKIFAELRKAAPGSPPLVWIVTPKALA